MYLQTHLVITIFAVLLLVGQVSNKIGFIIAALIGTLLPDTDMRFSRVGKYKIFRIPQLFVEHRGLTHSFIFLGIVVLVLMLFSYEIALGFFVGYALHLFLDSFSVRGLRFFYPFGKRTKGRFKSGGFLDTFLFILFLFLDLLLFWNYISKI